MTVPIVTRAGILPLLASTLAEVLAVDPATVVAGTRSRDGLRADALDLVEVVESVERRLHARGLRGRRSGEELMTLRTVGHAADRLLAVSSGASA